MIAYFDCFSGASGDMILGALVDAGLPLDTLQAELSRLPLQPEWGLTAETVRRGALRATQVRVTTAEASQHRHLADITGLIEASSLPAPVRDRSLGIFRRLAVAEARVHGIAVEEVHFHEVGAVDSIVDIVGAVIGLQALGVEKCYSSPLPLTGGSIGSQHGTLPLPAPATLELLTQALAPTRPWQGTMELVTPTGAAILTSLCVFEQPEMRLERIGYGAGGKDLPWPNVLRLWLGQPTAASAGHVVLETNIDDMNPEIYGYVMERLFAAGALDVYFTPIQMKKNRPATMLSVIARAVDEAALADILLRETTTLGLRVQAIRRHEAGREIRRVTTPYGEVDVKFKILAGRAVGAAPEYEACRKLAAERGQSFAAVYQAALLAASEYLGPPDPSVEKSG